jgi:hypothetical protein
VWGNPWGFESPLRHQVSVTTSFVARISPVPTTSAVIRASSADLSRRVRFEMH